MGSRRADGEDASVPLRVGLRQWVLGLTRSELVVIDGWIQHRLRDLASRPNRQLFAVPDAADALFTDDNFLTIASRVRLHITRLPMNQLVVLKAWLSAQMRGHGEL